ncbi:PspC domain-containing protein [Ornithinimicrobium pekingense]|uniref:Phage shock protein PspC N-terminal domain-containing protein n=1 Tax=Ornithinimicrobium pekingense TaxID=384677 RepID=A0ABQ2FAJ6_9MICO|nr:PspC domain-containing protein [Ornithinimicrobium pekingense]GGK77837.1 hypothetical protein GCM10011509_27960 [Ornithinimicrobium pekingense]
MNDTHRNDHDDHLPPAPPHHPPVPPQEPQGVPHPPPPTFGQPAPTAPGGTHDDVWGVRPPVLGQPPAGYDAAQGHGQPGYGQPGYGQQGPTGASGTSQLDRGLSALQKSPLRRDTNDGIIGGVAAGVAKRLNISTAAARLGFIALALFFGSGIAAYLIAWALLPDESGRTHVEQGVRGGNTQSLVITVLGGIAALGMISSVLDGLGWLVPIAVTAGIVWYVVSAGRKKGDGTTG